MNFLDSNKFYGLTHRFGASVVGSKFNTIAGAAAISAHKSVTSMGPAPDPISHSHSFLKHFSKIKF
jgi:hypothetical protein